MKMNREYFHSDKFFATVVVGIAVIAIISLVFMRESVPQSTGSKLIHRVAAPYVPPADSRLPETMQPTKVRIKAAKKEVNQETLKESNP